MIESGIHDFRLAKQKAAQQLGIGQTRNLPSNEEVQHALREYQRLFRAGQQPARLRALREAALKAMGLFAPFSPRIVGDVLDGSADQYSAIQLHLFANTPEEVALFLMEQKIPYQQGERTLRFGADRSQKLPVFSFVAGDDDIELTVFPTSGSKQPPLSPLDGHPLQRASRTELERLLQDDALVG